VVWDRDANHFPGDPIRLRCLRNTRSAPAHRNPVCGSGITVSWKLSKRVVPVPSFVILIPVMLSAGSTRGRISYRPQPDPVFGEISV
jgi:hypothetical protein